MKRILSSTRKYSKVTLFPGHGIGPEISESVETILYRANAGIEFEKYTVGLTPGQNGELISDQAIDSIKRNKLALKAPLETPIGKGHRSINLLLRQEMDAFANVRPLKNVPGVPTRYDGEVDLVIVRENTEGEYIGIEWEKPKGVATSLKIITEHSSRRIIEYAFNYAKANGRKKVTCVHKANIMKLTDGMFLRLATEIAEKYPDIEFDSVIVDACCMKLVQDPSQFDVMVMPNLYGDIVSDLGAGLIGGLGFASSFNHGEKASIYEAVHGSAPDIAGKGLANPIAFLNSSLFLLDDIGKKDIADNIRAAINDVLVNGSDSIKTPDLGGTGSTTSLTKAIVDRI